MWLCIFCCIWRSRMSIGQCRTFFFILIRVFRTFIFCLSYFFSFSFFILIWRQFKLIDFIKFIPIPHSLIPMIFETYIYTHTLTFTFKIFLLLIKNSIIVKWTWGNVRLFYSSIRRVPPAQFQSTHSYWIKHTHT